MPGTDVETRFTILERLRRLALRRYALFHKAMESYPLHSSIDSLATGRGDRPTSADHTAPMTRSQWETAKFIEAFPM